MFSPKSGEVEAYFKFVDCIKKLTQETGSDWVSNSAIAERLGIASDEFCFLRDRLAREGVIARGLDNSCKWLKEIAPAAERAKAKSEHEFEAEQLDRWVERLRTESKLQTTVFGNDLQAVKAFIKKVPEVYGLTCALNLDSECIELTSGAEKPDFLAQFSTDFKWYDEKLKIAAAKLADVFTYEELAEAGGEATLRVRNIIRFEKGRDDNSCKPEMISYLLHIHGFNLFRNLPVFAVEYAKKCGRQIAPTSNFKAALEFVRKFDFPQEFCGETEPDLKFPNYFSRTHLWPELRQAQLQARQKISEAIGVAAGRCVLGMPAAAGRLKIGVEAMNHWVRQYAESNKLEDQQRRPVVLWLCPSSEAAKKVTLQLANFYQTNRIRQHAVELISFTESDFSETASRRLKTRSHSAHIIVADATFFYSFAENREIKNDILELAVSHRLLVAVEKNIGEMSDFEINFIHRLQESGSDFSLLGLSDPWNDKDETKTDSELELFSDRTVELYGNDDYSVEKLIVEKVVARPTFRSFETDQQVATFEAEDLAYQNVETAPIERLQHVEQQLNMQISTWHRAKVTSRFISQQIRNADDRGIYFAAGAEDCDNVAWGLGTCGIAAVKLLPEQDMHLKEYILSEFANGAFQVLCTTEPIVAVGLKAPINHIFFGRIILRASAVESLFSDMLSGPKSGGADEVSLYLMRDRFSTEIDLRLGFDIIENRWQEQSVAATNEDDAANSDQVVIDPVVEEFVETEAESAESEPAADVEIEADDAILNVDASENVELIEEFEERDDVENLPEAAESSAEELVFADDIGIEPSKEVYFELEDDFEINISNTVDGIFNWLFNEIVGESRISSQKLVQEFRMINKANLEVFFSGLAEKLKREVETADQEIVISADMGTASKLSLNKASIKQLIKTVLLTEKANRAA